MMLGRTASSMVSLILVLFALDRYQSAAVAGAATFLSIAPGLLVSPIAGALLDRHGRTRLIFVDYVVAATALVLIALLDAAGSLPVPLLLLIVTAHSLTFPLSNAGMRTLFPVLVPRSLWERANAVDSNGYVVSSILGPAAAGGIVGFLGAGSALIAAAVVFAAAALAATGIYDPSERRAERPLLAEAWAGLVYVIRNPTLRGLAISVSIVNIGTGIFFLALPVLSLQRLGPSPAFVGAMFWLMGIAAGVWVLCFGRINKEVRERQLMAGSMLGQGAAMALVLFAPYVPTVALAMLAMRLATGRFDVTRFPLRPRRPDPTWSARGSAVPMGFNVPGLRCARSYG